ncbi:MAG TPA: DUF882 domain-containing protein [Xanthobacteraceae bacterium]
MRIDAARQVLTGAMSSRAGRCIGLAGLALLLCNQSLQNAVADGDTRTISLHHIHTGEDLTITFKRDGRYDEEALKKLNHLLRDWRRDEEIRMDPRLLDVVWEVYRDLDAKVPIQVVCGYRAPQTNAMLRRRSRGVAQFSQHTLGRAMDFFIPGVSLEAQREAGLRLQRGGVGYYPTSGSPFVHLDVGSVRHWPRMTHDQLARVFPNGRTVHIPSDGHPLAGYAVALADIQKRGSSEPSQMSIEAARAAGIHVASKQQPGLLASLFTSKDDEEDSETAAPNTTPSPAAAPKPEKVAAKIVETKTVEPKTVEPRIAAAKPIPLPAARPVLPIAAKTAASAGTFDLASADSQPARLTGPAPATRVADAPSPATNVISDRGYWEAPAAAAATAPPPPKARVQLASAETGPAPVPRAREPAAETTGTVAPWPLRTADADDATDHVPHDLALAYAAQANVAPANPVTRSIALAPAVARSAATLEQSGATTIANMNPPVRAADASELKPGTPLEDPWLRALVLAPDLQNYMTATLLGESDPLALRPLMEKPDAVVLMTFSEDPHLGMTTDHFGGSAVMFVSTVTFARRTASLQ